MWSAEISDFSLFQLFYFFLIYSFLGWALESCYVSCHTGKWVNRGFINGPFCPIYGTGALCMILFLTPLQNNLFLQFLGGVLVATVVEYAIAAVLEKLFHASWWDYSDKKFNIKGRVCFVRSIQWGALCVVMMHVLQPAVAWLVDKIPRFWGEIGIMAFLLYLVSDASVTIQQVLHLNEKLAYLRESREDIRAKLEKTKLYTTKKELAEYFEQLSSVEFLRKWRESMEETYAQMEDRRQEERLRAEYIWNEIREKLEYKVRVSEQNNLIQRRLLRAFPKLHSLNFDSELQEMRDAIQKRQKEKKERKERKQ